MRTQVVQKTGGPGRESDALDGFLVQATDLMYEALKIDPGNAIVAEAPGADEANAEGISAAAGTKRTTKCGGPATLKPQPGKKAVNVRGRDLEKAHTKQVAGECSELPVAFDPDLDVRRTSGLRLNEVDFYTAMQLLGVGIQDLLPGG